MSKRRGLIFASIVIIFLAGLIATLLVLRNQASTEPVTFTGKVTRTGNGCDHDAACFVEVDGHKIIITGCGLMSQSVSCAPYNQEQLKVGDTITATVLKEGDNYSLGYIGYPSSDDYPVCGKCKINKH
jgi:hypothetical protein